MSGVLTVAAGYILGRFAWMIWVGVLGTWVSRSKSKLAANVRVGAR